MSDDALDAAVELIVALVDDDLERAEDAALAALGRLRKQRAREAET